MGRGCCRCCAGKQTLTAKYGIELAKPTYVEIFADQRDFAVRTFGLPDVPGFLGVCFGRVVTANSPASSSSPTNWESVLWHEFCHVVTLQMTKNKMPRWLSEGISVYEERQVDPSWGMRIDPRYREMILGEDLVPVGKLSAAFLAPRRRGTCSLPTCSRRSWSSSSSRSSASRKLRDVLTDLREARRSTRRSRNTPCRLETLETDFAAMRRSVRSSSRPSSTGTRAEAELLLPDGARSWPNGKRITRQLLDSADQGAALIEQAEMGGGEGRLERLVELYPQQKGGESAYRPLVAAYRALNDTAGERGSLRRKWARSTTRRRMLTCG
jgi:hypothetical protein